MNQPQRTGPAKSVNLTDKCSIVTQQQWQALGADQTPLAKNSLGESGCNYGKGEPGTSGWSVFVAAASGQNLQQEMAVATAPIHNSGNLAGGYPFADYTSSIGCVLFADISDQAHLTVNITKNSSDDPGIDLCQQAEKFAHAAIQNLPNA